MDEDHLDQEHQWLRQLLGRLDNLTDMVDTRLVEIERRLPNVDRDLGDSLKK